MPEKAADVNKNLPPTLAGDRNPHTRTGDVGSEHNIFRG
jgi:hypothetical protein